MINTDRPACESSSVVYTEHTSGEPTPRDALNPSPSFRRLSKENKRSCCPPSQADQLGVRLTA
jgi:hypothetical protein